MKRVADQDSSVVFLVGSSIVKEEIEEEIKQDDEANGHVELLSVAEPENPKTPARGGRKEPLKSQNPKVINQNEHVQLDVSALQNSAGTAERPRRKAAAEAMARIHAVAAFENSETEAAGGRHNAPSKDNPQDPEVIDQDEHAEDDAATGSTGRPATRRSRAQSAICQVPRLLRHANVQQKQNCYEPQLISIGPLHHKKKRLRPMEQLKLQFRQKLLDRNKKVKLEDYRNEMVKLEQQAKKCYSSQSISKFSSDDYDFVEMMLLDGCFLVEMLLQNNEATVRKAPNISQEIWFLDFVARDMLLLENQLPYFVLDSIFNLFLQDKKKSDVGSMAKLVLACFQFTGLPLNDDARVKKSYLHLLHFHHHHCLPTSSANKKKNRNRTDFGAGGGGGIIDWCRKTSFVRLIRYSMTSFFSREPKMRSVKQLPLHTAPRPAVAKTMNSMTRKQGSKLKICKFPQGLKLKICKFPKLARTSFAIPVLHAVIHRAVSYFRSSRDPDEKPLSIPSAEEMEEAGITFEPEEFLGSFLSIKFSKEKGVLQIPYLYFGGGLHSLIQNLVAFEQCSCPDAEAFFVGYVLFMDCLISSGRDVTILRRSEVLDHGLGSDGEVADVINQMSRGVVWEPEYTPLAELYKDINEYCRRRRNRWRAYCKHNYCNTPCATVSLFAAIFLLLLTVTQTYFAIFPRS